MPTPTFQPPQGQLDTAQLQDWIVKLIRDLNFMLGNLDTLNVNRLDAKVVTTGILNAALVTIKAALTGLAYIQLSSAGMVINDGTKNTFTADINGLVTMVGALIQSAAGYPRVELNSVNSLFGAYQAIDQFVKMNPAASGTAPGFNFQNVAGVGLLYQLATDLFMATTLGSANIQISSGKDLWLSANTGSGYKTKMDSFSTVVDNLGASLQSKLDAKQNTITGASGTVYVSLTSGGPATTPITFSNGIRTS